MKIITNADFTEVTAQGVVVVDFFAERCGPCKMLAPYLEEMATKLEGKASFYKVDVDNDQELAGAQNITAMPTVKVFKDGIEVAMVRGADTKAIWTAVDSAVK